MNVCNRINKKNTYKDWINYNLDKSDHFKENLILEVKEPLCLDTVDDLAVHLKQVQDCGVEIVIDNFGSGFSSLTLLSKLPLDMVKIDKSMLDSHSQTDVGREILGALVEFTRHIGLKSIVSGVETEEQHNLVNSVDCDLKQGFLFSRPIPGNQLKPFLINSGKSSK